ncbi:hypothetical protein ABC347_16725 [Sphingomonas sp. 1P06PA]|uniref:hypothetical protein n=1 Tax=Sphingomonas sp. 1P06PA TaxID=554121 RepID=UPI0039A44160
MKSSLRRRLAGRACDALAFTLPEHTRGWADAIRQESAAIADDTAALRFVLSSCAGLLPSAFAARLSQPLVDPAVDPPSQSEAAFEMTSLQHATRSPRAIGAACLTGAMLLGLVYLAAAGAPLRYLGINAASLLLGLAMLACAGRAPLFRTYPGGLTLLLAGVLLATALLGRPVAGAARWVTLGGLSIQPSLILLPALILGFARMRSGLGAAGMIVAAVALAIQPDRAMAAMLVAGLGMMLLRRVDGVTRTAFAASLLGLLATLLQPDMLPAMPWVDGVFLSSFHVHPLAGAAVWGGALLILLPALALWRLDPQGRDVALVFATVWLAAIAAAAIGNYPTPVLGYGGSAILGYALSLIALPRRACTRMGVAGAQPASIPAPPHDQALRIQPT